MPAPGDVVLAVVAIVVLAVVVGGGLWLLIGYVRRVRRPESREILVVGVGGGGNNAVDRMVGAGIKAVGFVGFNTDAQALRRSKAGTKLRIGQATTGGLGSGGDPDVGRRAAEEDKDWIDKAVSGADLVFVTAGLGGGTGSGAAPIVAASARDQGALTIGVVTKPFGFEGSQRKRIADKAAAELASNVDALIVVPNDRVGDVLDPDASMDEAFRTVDDVLLHGVQGIIDLIASPGLINLDFADVRSVMAGAGPALIGMGRARGEHRAADAARQAIESPLLEARFEGARGILFNVSGPPDLRLGEVRQAADEIREHADDDANIIFGASFSESLGDEVLVTLIATGLNGHGTNGAAKNGGAPAEAKRRQRPSRRSAEPADRLEPAATSVDRPSPGPRSALPPSPVSPSPATSPNPAADEEDLDVPSFLRRRGGPGQSRASSSATS